MMVCDYNSSTASASPRAVEELPNWDIYHLMYFAKSIHFQGVAHGVYCYVYSRKISTLLSETHHLAIIELTVGPADRRALVQ